RQLQALDLAAAQGRERLAHPEIAQSDPFQHPERLLDLALTLEEGDRLLDRLVEKLIQRESVYLDLQYFGAVAPAPARVAGHPEVREEIHLHPLHPLALAALAAAALHVEGEGPGRVPPLPGERRSGVALADAVEGLHVGDRIGAEGAHHG